MFYPQIIVFLLVAADMALGGLISNGFIATVIIKEWTKCRSLASNEQLLLSLGISNICAVILQTASTITEYMVSFRNQLILPVIFFFAFFVTFFRFWLTAWLSVFYYIKIVNSPHSLFLWCKMRISWLIHRLLIGSLVISLLISFLIFHKILLQLQSDISANITNKTQEKTLRATIGSSKVLFLVTGTVCPFLVVLFCSILSVVFLCRHVRRMTTEKSSFRSLQTEAHIKAAWTVLFLLFAYVLFYVGETLVLTTDLGGKQSFVIFLIMLYSPAQAAIFVLVNPKLKWAATQILLRISQKQCKCTVCSHI
ncbi:taste receptor type 2 member 7-like [Sceloporus undulatus]|uniref:taste receptor type 2 member 7-like n=1 Tax=Sceloporus undulatus TaxID=8520 RepID=UPI001C4AF18A|nr:taste receptor type 2 member 7-like [Sceloporus undulatus]